MDVEARIFEKLDKIEDRINDLCVRLASVESEYNSHIEEIQRQQNSKLKRRDYTLAIMAISLTIIELCRSLGVL